MAANMMTCRYVNEIDTLTVDWGNQKRAATRVVRGDDKSGWTLYEGGNVVGFQVRNLTCHASRILMLPVGINSMKCNYQEFGDLLEVFWSYATEVMVDLDEDGVALRVDPDGNVIGFQIMGLKAFAGTLIEIPTEKVPPDDN
jgi:uncharacterized protein YuzE